MGWTNENEYGVCHRGGKVTGHIEGVAFPTERMAREEAAEFDCSDECQYCDGDGQNPQHEIVWRPVATGWRKLADVDQQHPAKNNRARSRAIRARMAATGEPYTLAARRHDEERSGD